MGAYNIPVAVCLLAKMPTRVKTDNNYLYYYFFRFAFSVMPLDVKPTTFSQKSVAANANARLQRNAGVRTKCYFFNRRQWVLLAVVVLQTFLSL